MDNAATPSESSTGFSDCLFQQQRTTTDSVDKSTPGDYLCFWQLGRLPFAVLSSLSKPRLIRRIQGLFSVTSRIIKMCIGCTRYGSFAAFGSNLSLCTARDDDRLADRAIRFWPILAQCTQCHEFGAECCASDLGQASRGYSRSSSGWNSDGTACLDRIKI